MKKLLILLFICSGALAHAQQMVNYSIYMRNVSYKTMWDGTVLRVFGFAPNIGNVPVPGPTLVCNEGDTLNVYVMNISQGNHHTIHWHGLDVPQNMDGVHETSFSIEHMMDTNLVFPATHAGTYLYHCHVASIVHVQMGMYGSVIVRAAGGANTAYTGGPAFDRDYLWLMSEFDKMWHDSLPQADSIHEGFPVPPFRPDYFMVNGLSKGQIAADTSTSFTARAGEKIYLRLSNIGYCMNRVVFPADFAATILSSDGRPAPAPVIGDTVMLAPGERYEVMLSPTTPFNYTAQVQYLNVNTMEVLETEFVPVTVLPPVSAEEETNASFAMYPNPAGDAVEVKWSGMDSEVKQIKISDLAGRVLQTKEVSGAAGSVMLQVNLLAQGTYLVQVSGDSRQWSFPLAVAR